MPVREIVTNQTLHALGFLSWMLAGLGLCTRWDAQSSAPGGVVPHTPGWAIAGLVVAAVFTVLAVGCHIGAFHACPLDTTESMAIVPVSAVGTGRVEGVDMTRCACGTEVTDGVNGYIGKAPWESEDSAECYACENAAMAAGERKAMEDAACAEERFRGEG